MISFRGYDDVIKRVYDNNQEHVFASWDRLGPGQRESLLKDLADVDFGLMKKLFTAAGAPSHGSYRPAPFIPLPKTPAEHEKFRKAAALGEELIRGGKVAAFIVAGGQGSRLGYEGPKGKFPVGPVSGKTLFRLHGEKILASGRRYGVAIPWFVMTSHANHRETVEYFESEKYFGLDPRDVFVFPQNMIPSLDEKGRLILESECGVFKNPDGHGGSLSALRTSGALDEMKSRGITVISYFQVDNPLVKIIDPVFIGFHRDAGADISSKALRKAYAEEKVGVFVQYADNTLGIVEYSDMPQEKINERDPGGELLYSSGNPAIHLFGREFIERITSSDLSLPYHTAKKKIAAHGGGEITGYKFEKFVFDALSMTDRNVILEVLREEEFAPVKNASGADSLETCIKLMDGLHRQWLGARGAKISAKTRIVEISPLYALGADDIPAGLALPERESVLLEAEVR